jgi:polyphosphate glucokinase
VLAIDVGGTHLKMLATDQKVSRKFVSGPKITAKQMVSTVKKLAEGWNYDAVSLGYPGMVWQGRILHEPTTLLPDG